MARAKLFPPHLLGRARVESITVPSEQLGALSRNMS